MYRKIKLNLGDYAWLLHIDFSENYACNYNQDISEEVISEPSTHWRVLNKGNITTFDMGSSGSGAEVD